MNKRLTILTIIIIGIVSSVNGQDRVFHSLKYAPYTEFFWTPASVEYVYTDLNDSIAYEYNNNFAFTYFSLVYTFRFDVVEPSDNFGVGINVSPSLGLARSDNGFGSFNIPAYLTLNFGAGSTYSTASNIGGYFGVGYEFNKIDLISTGDGYEEEFYDPRTNEPIVIEGPKTSWAEPMLIGGIRWWSKSEKLMELSIKYGFGSNGDLDPAPSNNPGKPKTIQITYGWFINY